MVELEGKQLKGEQNNRDYVRNYTWGAIQKMEHNYDSAFHYFKLSLTEATYSELPLLYITSCNFEIANLYDSLNMIDSAKHYYALTESLSKKYDLPEDLARCYYAMSNLANREGDINLAYYYKERYLAVSDSIFNIDELRKVEQSRLEYNQTLNKNEMYKLKRLSTSKNRWISLIIALLFIVVIVTLFIYRQSKE